MSWRFRKLERRKEEMEEEEESVGATTSRGRGGVVGPRGVTVGSRIGGGAHCECTLEDRERL